MNQAHGGERISDQTDGRSRTSFGWTGTLHHYPNNRARALYCTLVVLATVMLFYEFSVAGAVGPSIITDYHMSFHFYVYIAVAASVVGAFASLLAGLADRWGRRRLIAYGMVITAALTTFGLPNAPNKWVFLVLFSGLGFAQGVILVASSALVRDFSPQSSRASAMAFWSLGPVLGSLIVAEVSSHTLTHLLAWQDQYTICGIAGFVVAAITFFGLRELSPQLRDQLMVSSRERSLVEARAAGIDPASTTAHPWRQMLRFDIIGSALGISVFLLIYYVAVGFFVIYLTTVFGLSQARANSVTNWFWACEGGALIVVGILSDRLRVRKPFIAFGAIGTIVMTIVFLSRASHPHTSYGTLVAIVAVLAVMLGLVTGPWIAAFTETVERRNPALAATGLSIWGWVSRFAIAASTFALPFVVTAATPLVNYGPKVQALAATYAPQLATAEAVSPATLKTLSSDPTNTQAILAAVGQVEGNLHVSAPQALQDLVAVTKVPKADLLFLLDHGPAVKAAQGQAPGQWQRWFWVCIAGEVLFLPSIFVLAGRWRPSRSRRDTAIRDEAVMHDLETIGERPPLPIGV